MKKLKCFQPLILSIFLSFVLQFNAYTAKAQAERGESFGGGGTGGGATHYCLKYESEEVMGENGLTIGNFPKLSDASTAELYDLYEAREIRRGYKLINPGKKTANQLLNDAMKKIYAESPLYAYEILKSLKLYSEMKDVVYNKKFNVIKDANIVFTDENCEYREIAQWRGQYEKVFINGNLLELFNKSPLNVAGLALHEAVYHFERATFKATNSDHTRIVVGQSFSDKKLTLIPQDYLGATILPLYQNVGNPFQDVEDVTAKVLKTNSDKLFVRFKLLAKTPEADEFQFYISSKEFPSNMCVLKDVNSTCGIAIDKISSFKPIRIALTSMPKYFCRICPPPNTTLPEVQVEIFDTKGNKQFDDRLKLNFNDLRQSDNHFATVPGGKAEVGRILFQANPMFITVPTYDQGIEPVIRNLDITLK